MRRYPLWLGLIGVALFGLVALTHGTAAAQDAPEDDLIFDNEYCLGCHSQPDFQTTLPSGDVLDLTFDVEAFEASVHGELDIPCALCHTDITPFPHDPITDVNVRGFKLGRADSCLGCHLDQYTEAADNVHAAALDMGNANAAVCSDCHGAHDTTRPVAHSPEVPQTCRTCHSDIYDLYEDSVHGESLAELNRDVPTCTDCHGVHNVEGPTDSPFHLFSPLICADCHTDVDLMEEYDLSTNVLDSYVADFHGRTISIFERLAPDQETNKPVCIDCHGVHAIKKTDDPEGTVFKANLLQTCQRCHPDATENFSAAWLSHYSPEPGRATLVWLATWFYRILIPLVIGAMLLYVIANTVQRRRLARAEPA
ncbi:MAG: cytochrome c3 family protein [Acidimicrobiia bacterium]|nr:cytochrome c3 family protein [Acidimicrobiia bacterium]